MVTRDYYLTEVRIIQSGFVYYLKSLPHQLLAQQRRTGFVAAWHRFPGQHFIFLNGLVQTLFSSLKGWQDVGIDVTVAVKRRGRDRSWQSRAENLRPSTLTRPGYGQLLTESQLFTARVTRFSEKDSSDSLRKSYMQSTDF